MNNDGSRMPAPSVRRPPERLSWSERVARHAAANGRGWPSNTGTNSARPTVPGGTTAPAGTSGSDVPRYPGACRARPPAKLR